MLNIHKKQLKESIKKLIKEILSEEDTNKNVVMRTKVVKGKLENVLNDNIGLPFDAKEKQSILFKQGHYGVKSTIQKNDTEIKISTSDMFNNNKINVLKKLKNMSDANTCVYTAFISVVPLEEPQQNTDVPTNGASTEEEIYVKISQPFEDKSNGKLDILGDFFEQLELK